MQLADNRALALGFDVGWTLTPGGGTRGCRSW